MTEKLEQLFNLPPAETDEQINLDDVKLEVDADALPVVTEPVSQEVMDTGFKIDAALDTVRNLQDSDLDMDDLAKKATDAFDDLLDLANNVEDRHAGKIYEVASTMLGNAITAKQNKQDRKLKTIELQLKKLKLESDTKNPVVKQVMNDEVVINTRNDLLANLSAYKG